MTGRTAAVLAACAVVAGGVVAGIGLATRGSPQRTHSVLLVDEQRGRVGPVALGETRAGVVEALGAPTAVARGGPFAPAGKLPDEIGASMSFAIPGPRLPPEILRYPKLAVLLVQGRAFAIVTTDAAARTLKAVGNGQPLTAVRAAYRRAATCFLLPEGETDSGGDPARRFCRVRAPVGRLRFGRDPIASIALVEPAQR
jgi:hypothetical protein